MAFAAIKKSMTGHEAAAAEAITSQGNEPPLLLSIDAHGQLYLNVGANPRQPIDDQTALVRATAALRRAPERAVLVNGDQAVNYGRVVQAMVILQQAGAHKIGFQTDPLPKAPKQP